MKKLILFIAIFPVSALSQESKCLDYDGGYSVFHVNGVASAPSDGESNLRDIKSSIGPSINSKPASYFLSYNHTSNLIVDVLQAVSQLGVQFTSQIMRWMSGAPGIPAPLMAAMQQGLSSLSPVIAPELDQHLLQYRDSLYMGRRVLLVAHSQGNLYANEAMSLMQRRYPQLLKSGSMALVSVATPANQVAGATGPYVTNQQDFIHRLPGALPANSMLNPPTDGSAWTPLKAHDFREAYWNPQFNLQTLLTQSILGTAASLKPPPMGNDEGPLSISLSWSGAYDVDLALYEPDGRFVSSLFSTAPNSAVPEPPKGRVGYTLGDQRNAGTESYHTACHQIIPGTYLIGAEYVADTSVRIDPSLNALCAEALNGTVSEHQFLNKASCYARSENGTPGVSLPLNFVIKTPAQTHRIPVTLALPAVGPEPTLPEVIDWTYQRFVAAARLTIREDSQNADPNERPRLLWEVEPLYQQLPLPYLWKAAIDQALSQLVS